MFVHQEYSFHGSRLSPSTVALASTRFENRRSRSLNLGFLSLSFTMDYHLVSVPASGNRQNTFQNLRGKLAEFANTYSFNIPEFKVG
jgi:hypothetical protein